MHPDLRRLAESMAQRGEPAPEPERIHRPVSSETRLRAALDALADWLEEPRSPSRKGVFEAEEKLCSPRDRKTLRRIVKATAVGIRR